MGKEKQRHVTNRGDRLHAGSLEGLRAAILNTSLLPRGERAMGSRIKPLRKMPGGSSALPAGLAQPADSL
jgi:hypothetical protein